MVMQEQVQRNFSFLFRDHGFVFVHDPDADNEIVVVAKADCLRIRFIRDRADFFVDIGSKNAPDHWIALYDLLDELRRAGTVASDYKYVNKIGPLSNVLKRHFYAVKDLMCQR